MKTGRFIATAIFLAIGGYTLQAAYLRSVSQMVTQPDGALLQCFATGDEYYHWLHDKNDYTIIVNPESGFYVYADLLGDSLIPTPFIPGIDDPAAAGLVPGSNISESRYRALFSNRFKDPAFKAGRSYNNTGNYNNLVIFIRFKNQNEYTESLSVYSQAFNASNSVSLMEYFKEVSKSQLNITTTFYPNSTGGSIISYQDAYMRRYYQPYNASTNPDGYRTDNEYVNREMTLLKNAAESVKTQVEASGIDYDHDNDGYIDNVCFIIQGQTDGWSDLLWPHRWVLYTHDVRIGGARVYDFNFQLSEALGVSVLCHEMFHSLGAPDLYRYENNDIVPVGPWDLMAQNKTPPQHMSAYMKMKYGKWFQQIPTITADGVYNLSPLAADAFAAYKIPSPNSTQEFFVVEYRRATGRFESSLVGSGLIIYRINQSLDGNAQGPPDEVYVYRLNGSQRSNGNINSAAFSSNTGRTEFNDNTNPSSFLSNGGTGGIRISSIGPAGETIAFTIGSGSLLNPPRDLTASLSERTVNLAWKQPLAGQATLAGYKVYRNQIAVATINNPNILEYSDTSLANGTYQYHITGTYSMPAGESAGSNTVTVLAGGEVKPDLMVVNQSVMPVNVEPGSAVSLSCKIGNKGNAHAGASMLRIFLSRDEVFDSGDLQMAASPIGAIEAGYSFDFNQTGIEISPTVQIGNWFVLFKCDADGAVVESIENNNQSSVIIKVGNPAFNPPKNLVAFPEQSAVRLSWEAPDPTGGTLSGFKVYRNDTGISRIDNPDILSFLDSGLGTGTYDYFVTALYSSPEGESVKSNEVSVTLTEEAKADLTITNFRLTPEEVAPGGSIDIYCTLLNMGGAGAGTSEVRLYLSTDEVYHSDDIYLAYGKMDPLEPGEAVNISGEDIFVPKTLAPGNWFALIMADAGMVVGESNENNNLVSSPLNVQGNIPDLQITFISLFPELITPTSNVRITFNVYNSGAAPSSTFKTSFFLSEDEFLDKNDQEVSNKTTRLLGAKTNVILYTGFDLESNYSPGPYFLIGRVDNEGVVTESDENNNVSVIVVTLAGTSGNEGTDLDDPVRIFPVPAKGVINILFRGISGSPSIIRLTDQMGREFYRKELIMSFRNHFTTDTGDWPEGIYYAQLLEGGKVYTKRFMVR